MSVYEIKKGIFWVGAVDWNVRNFHGHTYATKKGTTYNAYLIIDEKITLVDTVYGSFSSVLIENISRIIDPAKINYIIANHVETDHSGALPQLMQICPGAKIFGTAKCKEGLFRHYRKDWDFQVVKTNDELNLGSRRLVFIEAPMIHWPDSMFTYCPQEQLLMPNDAFGQHYATSQRFDDEVDSCVLMEEAAKYYANILWPLSGVIAKKIKELLNMNIAVNMIAPSHGIIWRRDPSKIIDAYSSWAANETKQKVVVLYETMWQSTEKMAEKITEGISECGIEVKLFDINRVSPTELTKEMLDAKGFLIGSSTHNNDMLANLAGFLDFLKGLKPLNRITAVFGSYGWAGGAIENIEKMLKQSGLTISLLSLGVQYVPDQPALKKCVDFGKEFAEIVKK